MANLVVVQSLSHVWLFATPGLQHARFPCLLQSPRACSKSCPFSQWCHPAIFSSVVPFSSCLQSFPASGSFPMSQLFISGGQSLSLLQHHNSKAWSLWCSDFLNNKPRHGIKKQRHYFADKFPYSQSYGFSSSHVWVWALNHIEGWVSTKESLLSNCGVGEDT